MMLRKVLKQFFREIDLGVVILILVGTITWSLTMVKSGLVYHFGMGFWGPNGHDGVWHIALAEGLSNGSWQMPIFAGENIRNYHIGFDLILAVIHKLTFIPIKTLYFQILPPLLSLLIGIFCYKFVYIWRKSRSQAFWSTFFLYFGGDWGFIVTLIRNGRIGGESIFWSQQSISTLINPPFAVSLLFIFVGLFLLCKSLKNQKLDSNSRKYLIIVTFLFGFLVQIKVYAAILFLIGLFFSGVLWMLKRKGTNLIKVFTGTFILSILLLSFNTDEVGKRITFQPFWFLETMMGLSDRFYWPKFYQAMINYKLAKVLLKGIFSYTFAFFLFLIGNLGTRIIAFFYLSKIVRNFVRIDIFTLFFLSFILGGIFFPTFFVQTGTPWNTIQFFYYSLFAFGVLAGITLGKMKEKLANKWLSTFILMVVVFLTLPTSLGTLWFNYLPSRPPSMIPNEELEALSFLYNQPDGVVLTYPFDRLKAKQAESNPPRPLFLYESTAYVSAFSGKPVFLEDEVNLDITGYDWVQRRKEVFEFLESNDRNFSFDFLRKNKITYVYWIKDQRAVLGESQLGIEQIFENQLVKIYKVI